ncbi:segregation/condensation protein A [Candidatus Woesearchaeota archaeon]|nr:segregation/condensation protein A [Candidatus Woesearchaeota archaeon]
MQDKIHDIIFSQDDLTWKSLIFELIRKENMDPWDIDVKLIAEHFLGLLKHYQKTDLKISGKVILASALLLKMKSDKFLKEDFSKIDLLFHESEESDDDDYDFEDDFNFSRAELSDEDSKQLRLVPRTPQPRKRKVSIFDLVNALEQALDVKDRRANRLSRFDAPEVTRPKKNFDITEEISSIHSRVSEMFGRLGRRVSFDELVPGSTKEDKVYTFIPLLHLVNQRKVDVFQEFHFGNIEVEPITQATITQEQPQEIEEQN